jgi:antitoxin component of MazEF toxin-antitoxin module
MPLVRKLVEIGNSKAVFLPKSWVEYYEEKFGQKIAEVAIEVNKILKIAPIFREKRQRR